MSETQIPLIVDAADEGRHPADDDELWSESHYLDVVNADHATGFYARIGRLANQGCTHFVIALVRRGGPTIMLVDNTAPLPEEIGTGGEQITDARFEFAMECQEELRRFRVTYRGIAYEYADATDALHQSNGRDVHVEVDLVWETDATPYRWRISTRYEIPCRVSGQVRVDGEVIEFDGPGQRDHSWGARPWWALDWCWTAFHLEDGERWHTTSMPIFPGASVGYRQSDGVLTELGEVTAETVKTVPGEFGDTLLVAAPPETSMTLTPVAFAPIKLVSKTGEVTWFNRAMCEVTTADDRRGAGWMEWNFVQPATEA